MTWRSARQSRIFPLLVPAVFGPEILNSPKNINRVGPEIASVSEMGFGRRRPWRSRASVRARACCLDLFCKERRRKRIAPVLSSQPFGFAALVLSTGSLCCEQQLAPADRLQGLPGLPPLLEGRPHCMVRLVVMTSWVSLLEQPRHEVPERPPLGPPPVGRLGRPGLLTQRNAAMVRLAA